MAVRRNAKVSDYEVLKRLLATFSGLCAGVFLTVALINAANVQGNNATVVMQSLFYGSLVLFAGVILVMAFWGFVLEK